MVLTTDPATWCSVDPPGPPGDEWCQTRSRPTPRGGPDPGHRPLRGHGRSQRHSIGAALDGPHRPILRTLCRPSRPTGIASRPGGGIKRSRDHWCSPTSPGSPTSPSGWRPTGGSEPGAHRGPQPGLRLDDLPWSPARGQLPKFGGDALLFLFQGPDHASTPVAAVEMRSAPRRARKDPHELREGPPADVDRRAPRAHPPLPRRRLASRVHGRRAGRQHDPSPWRATPTRGRSSSAPARGPVPAGTSYAAQRPKGSSSPGAPPASSPSGRPAAKGDLVRGDRGLPAGDTPRAPGSTPRWSPSTGWPSSVREVRRLPTTSGSRRALVGLGRRATRAGRRVETATDEQTRHLHGIRCGPERGVHPRHRPCPPPAKTTSNEC